MVRMGHLSYKERLTEFELFSVEMRRFGSDLVAAFQYLKGTYMKDEARLFITTCSNRTRWNLFKLEENRSRLVNRRKIFTVRVMKHWNRLPTEAMDTPLLEAFMARLDGALRTSGPVRGAPAHGGGVRTRYYSMSFLTRAVPREEPRRTRLTRFCHCHIGSSQHSATQPRPR